jgi:micrococcal nuclease
MAQLLSAILAALFALSPAHDHEVARFARCAGPVRVTCVVDGDTFWYRGAKIRVADINAPEVSAPRCAAEARLGARATRRLAALLSAGPFTLQPADRARDSYGRRLFTVTRGGESLGAALEAEGLAEHWRGPGRDWRSNWC